MLKMEKTCGAMILKQCLHLKIPHRIFIQIRNKLYDGNGNGWVGLNGLPAGWDDPKYIPQEQQLMEVYWCR